ncbi:ATP-binding cassette domain-containing protein [Ancylobacter sp.]|uniref:ATP-binding cassette domain-containing protein n=1 Tax=Ancylobacter sp. TaxID=1872567 RepID=UPI003D133C6B
MHRDRPRVVARSQAALPRRIHRLSRPSRGRRGADRDPPAARGRAHHRLRLASSRRSPRGRRRSHHPEGWPPGRTVHGGRDRPRRDPPPHGGARHIGWNLPCPPRPCRAGDGPGVPRHGNRASRRRAERIARRGGGEILGIAGLKGAGGEALLAAIAGDRPLAHGAMELSGAPYSPKQPADGWRGGVAHLPGDRTGEGLIVDFSVLDNLVMARPPRRGPFFDRAAALDIAAALIRRIGIKAPYADLPVRTLSGGNMQKVVLGKCLATRPKLLLLNNPTRGVDVGARLEIYRIIRDLAADGLAVVLLSEDLPELLGLADRLLVMRHGEIVHRCEAVGASEHDIVRHMT